MISNDVYCVQAKLNYPIYCAPIENGIVAESESHKLWKNIEPHLRDALRTVYLGEISRYVIGDV